MPAPSAVGRSKLATVEAGRGLAALAVVAFHANASARFLGQETYWLLSLGEHGVDFFFVLSGFIICFIHAGDIGQPARAWNYLRKRLHRIVPTLWLIVGLCCLALIMRGKAIDPDSIGTSLFLYPSREPTIPLVVWTLRHEALFYCAFLLLVLHRRLGMLVIAGLLGGACVQLVLAGLGRPITGLAAFVLSPFHLDFAMGAGIALMHRRLAFRPSLWPLALGAAAVGLALAADQAFGMNRQGLLDYTSFAATVWTVVLGAAFALLLHGLLCAESKITVPALLTGLGASSYALYLVHTPVNSLVQHAAAKLGQGWTHFALVVAGIAAGALLHLWFERPVGKWLAGPRRDPEPARSVPI